MEPRFPISAFSSGRRPEIEQLLSLKVSKASIAKIVGVSRSALVAFMGRRGTRSDR